MIHEHLPSPNHSVPPLPNGEYKVWEYFVLNDGYFAVDRRLGKVPKLKILTEFDKNEVISFVYPILHSRGVNSGRRGWLSNQMHFHNSLKQLRSSFMEAPRDFWEKALPPKSDDSYEFSTLLLMLCSSLIKDEQLVPFMHALFSKYHVTPKFVLDQHLNNPHFWEETLHDLGHQYVNACTLIEAANTTVFLGRVPQNYTQIVLNYQGIGPKMALVTVDASYGDIVRH